MTNSQGGELSLSPVTGRELSEIKPQVKREKLMFEACGLVRRRL